MKNPTPLRRLILAAMFIAIGFVLPFVTGSIPQIGSALLPMHLPVLIAGFVCGGPLGAAVGAVLPLMRHFLLGMPPLMTAIAMTFELAVYGLMTGLLYKLLPKKPVFIYVNLVIAMVLGRVAWGVVRFALMGLGQSEFSLAAFWAGGFVTAVPGIVLQIVLIPVIILALRRAGVMESEDK